MFAEPRQFGQGMLFADCYAQASCTARRANFITEELPIRTGMITVGQAGAKIGAIFQLVQVPILALRVRRAGDGQGNPNLPGISADAARRASTSTQSKRRWQNGWPRRKPRRKDPATKTDHHNGGRFARAALQKPPTEVVDCHAFEPSIKTGAPNEPVLSGGKANSVDCSVEYLVPRADR
jgi:hypothetical protein